MPPELTIEDQDEGPKTNCKKRGRKESAPKPPLKSQNETPGEQNEFEQIRKKPKRTTRSSMEPIPEQGPLGLLGARTGDEDRNEKEPTEYPVENNVQFLQGEKEKGARYPPETHQKQGRSATEPGLFTSTQKGEQMDQGSCSSLGIGRQGEGISGERVSSKSGLETKSGLKDDKRERERLANHSATFYSIQHQDSIPEEEDC